MQSIPPGERPANLAQSDRLRGWVKRNGRLVREDALHWEGRP